ncbi:low molecular weight phosphotyrosine protein phosphatase [Brevibacillus sp. SYP-B805]|uniref:low molecular weight protein-tyrosine-phosphatase n=1 Tax=Brevibacillus sp. SYP-B805 TaxID=1578199 RepID=UPI0013EDA398|nr:low molecular weight protein-tyrosine-phosphatase [Brevibacillus sp. SYP-B805]NGQ96636.1 low molecular weight phosphotyrosine protein phosphatase [Brevibacillus sp. SYP-B805]
MIHVLFVCLGNICRSPMAEAVFRHLVAEAGLSDQIAVDSAGLGGWHEGEAPHHGTQEVLRKRQIAYDTIVARQIRKEDFASFDYIVCMDEENLAGLRGRAPAGKKLYRLLDFAPELPERNVEDPYYTGRFEHVYRLVEAGCRGLLKHLCAEHGLIYPAD